jgi:HD-GYP domain-containing protein (c-di-GMP phosphodiesterase class II)
MSDGPNPPLSGGDDQALALALAVAVRTAAYFDPDNAVMQQACDLLGSLLAEHDENEDPVTIGVRSHCIFVGKARVRTTVSTYGRFTFLIQLFESWDISTLTFSAELTRDVLMQVVLLLARERRGESGDLAAVLRSRGLDGVEVDLFVGEGQAQAVTPVELYAAAIQLSDEMLAAAESGKPPAVRPLRRVTQAMVDLILRDPQSLVALTTIKDFDRFFVCHSIDVAVLAVVLGQRLGMRKTKLGELCLAAFLHDAGKLGLQRDILEKPGTLDPADWEEIRRHPILAARALLDGLRLTPSNMKSVVVAFEHHLDFDMSGYPPIEIKDKLSLFGSIVGIADRYDALTSPRAYRDRNLTPHEALAFIVGEMGRLFDPLLVKLFVEVMGVYPPGTLVELSSGELAVVCASPAPGRPIDRPKVRVVSGGDRGSVLELDELFEGKYLRSVEQVLNPGNKGQVPAIDFSEFETAD